jgi:LemA protein
LSADQLWLVAGAALLVFWMLGAYNRLVALRNTIIDAWAQYEEPLRRRSQALAALLDAFPATLAQEAGTLDAVRAADTQLQAAAERLRRRPASASRAAALVSAEAALAPPLARLLSLLEQGAVPAAGEVAEPLAALHESAQRLGFARQLFNDAVRGYNDAVRQFPTRLLSALFGFGSAGTL